VGLASDDCWFTSWNAEKNTGNVKQDLTLKGKKKNPSVFKKVEIRVDYALLLKHTKEVKWNIQDLAAASNSRKDATETLLDKSMSDSSFVIHCSKEYLLCNKTKSFKNIGHLNANEMKFSY
jgi:hypothetical protein